MEQTAEMLLLLPVREVVAVLSPATLISQREGEDRVFMLRTVWEQTNRALDRYPTTLIAPCDPRLGKQQFSESPGAQAQCRDCAGFRALTKAETLYL